MIHRPNEEGKGSCEHGSEEHIGRYGASAIPRKRVDEVVQGCSKDCREPDAGEEDADNRRPEIYLGIGCPCV